MHLFFPSLVKELGAKKLLGISNMGVAALKSKQEITKEKESSPSPAWTLAR
jgi:hypothetical protein